jgi:propanol-preferring alcohol dehydrogenase
MDEQSSLPARYLAMVLAEAAAHRLEPRELAPAPLGPGQLRLRVHTCGVCRSDLHVVDGELPDIHLPRIPGHEIVGTVVERGPGCTRVALGDRVGVPWLAGTCGACDYCGSGRENLCAQAAFTGYTVDGGYAEYAVANEAFTFELPANYSDEQAAPLLCAGLIGYRALQMAQQARRIGIYGFGAAGHLIAQVALAQGRRVFAFTRPQDAAAQALARELGVHWVGDSTQAPPELMEAAILFAPVGSLVPQSLQHVAPGGAVVCAGIHMSDIPAFPYRRLWMERSIRSVANLTRADGEGFFRWAADHTLKLSTTAYPLLRANDALDDLRAGRITGAAVLHC